MEAPEEHLELIHLDAVIAVWAEILQVPQIGKDEPSIRIVCVCASDVRL